MQEDIKSYQRNIKDIDTSVNRNNNMLHTRLNRADIDVSGVSEGLNHIGDVVMRLCSHFSINVAINDLFHVCYMNNKKALLVKFNNLVKRS